MKTTSLLAFILYIILILSCNGKKQDPSKTYFIDAPFENIKIPKEALEIDPSKDQVLRFENGISVDIPKDAFVDKNGKPVTSPVKIALEKYESPAEIIASGIPMRYGEAPFESAGMFKIEGEANGEPIAIQKGKALQVNYPSATMGDFDVYYFEEKPNKSDTAKKEGKWKKLTDKKESSFDPKKVVNTFNLKFDTAAYPELAALQNIQWKLATSDRDPSHADNNWVLQQPWAELEISLPKEGFGKEKMRTKAKYASYMEDWGYFYSWYDGDFSIFNFDYKKIKTIKASEHTSPYYNCIHEADYNRNKMYKLFYPDGRLFFEKEAIYNISIDKNLKVISYQQGTYLTKMNTKLEKVGGELIKEIELEHDFNNNSIGRYSIFSSFIKDNDKWVAADINGIKIFDFSGNLIKQKEGKFHSCSDFHEKDLLEITHIDGRLEIWNSNSGKTYISNLNDFDMRPTVIANSTFYPYTLHLSNKDYILISKNYQADRHPIKLWLYEKNEVRILKGDYVQEIDTSSEWLIIKNNINKDLYIYNTQKDKYVISIPNCNASPSIGDGYWMPNRVSKDNKHLILNLDKLVRLYDTQGKLIRDFSAFDSLTVLAHFIGNKEVFTISRDGIYRLWDIKGNLLQKISLDNAFHIYPYVWEGHFHFYDMIFRTMREYDLQANLLRNQGRNYWNQVLPNGDHLFWNSETEEIFVSSPFELEKDMYQLSIRTDKKEFITYIYLSEQEKRTIEAYYTFKMKKVNEEKERQDEEMKLIRSFAVQEFGIYNYDVLVKFDEAIELVADFDLGVPIDYNNITIFHISQLRGNAVFILPRWAWNRFAFLPDRPNRLLAILPDKRIAVFTEADFRALDLNKLKADKKYTFKLRILEEKIASMEDLAKLTTL